MRTTRPLLSLAAILILGTIFRFIVGGASRPAYRFEQEPRPVLEKSGLRWSRNPKLAVSSSGVLYLLSTSGESNQTELSLLLSHDGGDTFLAPVRISEAHAQVRSHGESSPTLVETPTAIYVLWEQNGENGSVDLMLARSRSFGHRFDKPVRVIDKTKPSFNGFSSLGVAPNGDVYVVWLDGRDALKPREHSHCIWLDPRTGAPPSSPICACAKMPVRAAVRKLRLAARANCMSPGAAYFLATYGTSFFPNPAMPAEAFWHRCA